MIAGARPSAWTASHVAQIAPDAMPCAPLIAADWGDRPVPGLDLWDFWPVQAMDGQIASRGHGLGGAWWMALAAPAAGDPAERHVQARIRLLWRHGGRFSDCGPLLPPGFGPGSREWSGSAIVESDGRHLRLFFTAAGAAGEPAPGWQQRLMWTRAALPDTGSRLTGWTMPQAIVASDGDLYHPADQRDGSPGTIKAFRDPGFFRDPADGRCYMLFTASLGRSASPWNGAIGLAQAADDRLSRWALRPPIISADGLNNELERPHMIAAGGQYYLFWSTQRQVFAPTGPAGPTGLYGMAGPSVHGPFTPLNGSGLVIANPPAAPRQAYSWLVTPDLVVSSFVDETPGNARRFGGVAAPMLQLALDGTATRLLGPAPG